MGQQKLATSKAAAAALSNSNCLRHLYKKSYPNLFDVYLKSDNSRGVKLGTKHNKMLKYFVIFSCALLFLSIVNANDDDRTATLTSSYREQDRLGNFKHGHVVSNGINVKAEGNVNRIQGEYFLPDENGGQIRVTYTADATGFHPQVESH